MKQGGFLDMPQLLQVQVMTSLKKSTVEMRFEISCSIVRIAVKVHGRLEYTSPPTCKWRFASNEIVSNGVI